MPGLRLFRNDPRLLFLICSLISRDRLIILPLKRKYARTMFNQNPAVAVVIILWQASMLLQVERSVIILQQAGINWWMLWSPAPGLRLRSCDGHFFGYISLDYITLDYITLDNISLDYISLDYIYLDYTTLYYISLDYIT